MQVVFVEDDRPPSVVLRSALHASAGPTVTLGELVVSAGRHGLLLLAMLLTAPCLLPVSIPGSSTALGFGIILIGIGVALDRVPWLPRWLMMRSLPRERAESLVHAAAALLERIERFSRPRWTMISDGWLRRLHGSTLALAGLLLMAPLPIPFTNTFPAWAALLLAGGIGHRDGLLLLLGYGLTLAAIGYFALLGGVALVAGDGLLSLVGCQTQAPVSPPP